MTESAVKPDPAWGPVEAIDTSIWPNGFVTGAHNENRIAISLWWSIDSKRLFARVRFGEWAEGPPGCAHGGALGAVLDDAMGRSAWLDGHRVVAGKLGITYRKPLPLHTTATLVAWVEGVDGRKLTIRSTLHTEDGVLACEGEGLFIAVDPSKFQKKVFG